MNCSFKGDARFTQSLHWPNHPHTDSTLYTLQHPIQLFFSQCMIISCLHLDHQSSGRTHRGMTAQSEQGVTNSFSYRRVCEHQQMVKCSRKVFPAQKILNKCLWNERINTQTHIVKASILSSLLLPIGSEDILHVILDNHFSSDKEKYNQKAFQKLLCDFTKHIYDCCVVFQINRSCSLQLCEQQRVKQLRSKMQQKVPNINIFRGHFNNNILFLTFSQHRQKLYQSIHFSLLNPKLTLNK